MIPSAAAIGRWIDNFIEAMDRRTQVEQNKTDAIDRLTDAVIDFRLEYREK